MKKRVTAILSIIAMVLSTANASETIRADVNGDGKVNTADAVEVYNVILKTREVTSITIDDFPTTGWSDDETIGTADTGKTAWAKGDVVTLSLNSPALGEKCYTLTYDGDGWAHDAAIAFSYLVDEAYTGTAVYSPTGELGMEEYLVGSCTIEDGEITITFTGREYSRLRIVSTSGQTLTISTEGFTPAGTTSVATEPYTLTADDNGNAYIYGAFAEGATVSVKQGDATLIEHAFVTASESGKSYALDARPPYIYNEATNTYTVYTAEGLLAWNEAACADLTINLVLKADITLTGENNWAPISGKDEYGRNIFYTGTINGDGHIITGLRINSNSEYQGFIGQLGEGGTVKNLTFADAVVSAGQYSGIVVGGSNGTIENCHVTSGSLTATNQYTGCIVGSNGGIVINCTNATTITVAQGATNVNNLGGIAGMNNGTVMGCINTGTILSGNLNIGGVVGDNNKIVVACSNKGAVTGSSQTGGIVGRNAQSGAQTIGLWATTTTEYDADGNGIGHDKKGTIGGCFVGDVASINAKVSEMNNAIATYNETATVKCPYTWQAGTDGYPTLVKSE